MTPGAKRTIYLDHAAATPLGPAVAAAMAPYWSQDFGNPSSLHTLGRTAAQALAASRQVVAEILHTTPDTIVFTGSGTEANNLALYGVARAHQGQGRHSISLAIEHPSVLEPLQDLRQHAFETTFVALDAQGRVNPDVVVAAITPQTILVSIMYANNEIGTIAPIADIGREILKYRKKQKTPYPYFYTDACQAAGYLNVDVEKLHVDLLTLNGSKVYGPKGTGLLYVRRGLQLGPLVRGGGQESGRRAGTENIPGIIGLAKALQLAKGQAANESDRLRKISKKFCEDVSAEFPDAVLTGPEVGPDRLPNNIHLAFAGLEREQLLIYLNERGIMASAGSGCAAGSPEPSHVLTALGLSSDLINGSVRFSLGRSTTPDDVAYVVEQLRSVLPLLRQR